MKRIFFALAILVSFAAPSQNTVHIIPAPAKVDMQQGTFLLSPSTVIVLNNKGEQASANFLNDYLQQFYGFRLKLVAQATKNSINLTTPTFIRKPDNEERYTLNVSPTSISIQGDSKAGTFYGMQTLIQLLPIPPSTKRPITNYKFPIPCILVEDQPRFPYRGMHLDVSRHFFPVSYVKKYIDYIALHKMNYFHWHLTDDQGWRIEIKKYPKLTSVGAWRDGTIIGRFPGTGNDSIHYGGFYTQEQIREIVQYAANRYITVLPEIEMPGHSMAALAAYPELGTTPDIKTKVAMTWGLNGVVNNVFAPTEKTFGFLEDVLTEVMQLFPSQMIHIGGDECSKIWWKKDSASQRLMREKGLKDEDELQSYFIQRMEKFVNSKGRKIIGWDEILEGGLAPNASVMSWTGEKGGIHAAKEKHNVVMTPGGWCYFDHSQTNNEDSVTIGSYLPLEKVYGYEPVPAELGLDEAKYILGAQANLWTEYIAYPSKVEYMLFPRMSALSEVLWSSKEKRNWESFEKRLPTQMKRYELWKANYSKAYYAVKEEIFPSSDTSAQLIWRLIPKRPQKLLIRLVRPSYESVKTQISDTTIALLPFEDDPQSVVVYQYASVDEKGRLANKVVRTFNFNKATGRKITSNIEPSPSYPGNGGLFSLVNGVKSERGINSNEWCGWSGKQVELLIDLGKEMDIKEVNLHILSQPSSWIYAPKSFDIELSKDGINFEDPHHGFLDFDQYANENPMKWMKRKLSENPNLEFPTRFIKLKLAALEKIPEGNPGAGKEAWMFIDEVEVN